MNGKIFAWHICILPMCLIVCLCEHTHFVVFCLIKIPFYFALFEDLHIFILLWKRQHMYTTDACLMHIMQETKNSRIKMINYIKQFVSWQSVQAKFYLKHNILDRLLCMYNVGQIISLSVHCLILSDKILCHVSFAVVPKALCLNSLRNN